MNGLSEKSFGFIFVAVKRGYQNGVDGIFFFTVKADFSIGSGNFFANWAGLILFELDFIEAFLAKPFAMLVARNTKSGEENVEYEVVEFGGPGMSHVFFCREQKFLFPT